MQLVIIIQKIILQLLSPDNKTSKTKPSSTATKIHISESKMSINSTTTGVQQRSSARSSTASFIGGGGVTTAPYSGSAFYSCDVPPLHRRSFLGPGDMGNLAMADSQDNIAQLIPRFVLYI